MSQVTALLLTIAIEVAVAVALLARTRWHGEEQPLRGPAFAVASASLITHPAAWWASHVGLSGMPYALKVIVIEGTVIAVEAAILGLALRMRPHRALLLSAATNLASFAIGLALIRALPR